MTVEPSASAALPPPALIAGVTSAIWLSSEGELERLTVGEARRRAEESPPLLVHTRATARRLGLERLRAYDLLELFAFIRPAVFCPPTARGIALAVGLHPPDDEEDQPFSLRQSAGALLRELEARGPSGDPQALGVAFTMTRAGWLWGPWVLRALGIQRSAQAPRIGSGYRIWEGLEEWSEQPPEAPTSHFPVEPGAARARLSQALGADAEARPQQADYASAVCPAFAPREEEGKPQLVLAEAGTGVGKTLGYIAPASLWAEKNGKAVWLSTYTRNLQQQLDGELDRLFPQVAEKRGKVVIRKGRENYLCLLNYAERMPAVTGVQAGEAAVPLGLVARWALRTRDGDLASGDFPGWLSEVIGRGRIMSLVDRRGECIHSACDFWKKCFVEKSIRRARSAELVIANHALVMIQAALGGGEEEGLPLRYVFDEGHHLFEAADSAFAAHLSGQETAELRRWLLGGQGRRGGSSRMRGLARRMEGLFDEGDGLDRALVQLLRAARRLPADGWYLRLSEGRAEGPFEAFLLAVRTQVYARAEKAGEGYSLECELRPVSPELLETGLALEAQLRALLQPGKRIAFLLARMLDQEAEQLDRDQRRRLESLIRSLERRLLLPVEAWQGMLRALHEESPEDFVDWLAVERIEGREIDVGLQRHWIDPTKPLARAVLERAHGALITSATLTDRSGEPEADWRLAEARVGALHLSNPPVRAQVSSPFDYGLQTRVFIVTDVRKDDLDQVAAAIRELFLASGGGALGLFTAISRLKAVHQRIAAPLERAGLNLLAQHVDGMDVSTLIEIFRAEAESCLLGTDAVRDGVDVPGQALRLIVFDRVPWPRPDLRHKARRQRFGGRGYDDRLTRLKLRQGFGRLIRRTDDRGVFVLLDPMMPSRLYGAFPEGVLPQRVGLAEALAETRAFLASGNDETQWDVEAPQAE
ncbi:MAG TPA: ATP-dependent DNA helicase [Kiloniellales bacterium]|nr:ATP-dependent DNA helicase [Kiloniellales bacterium]